jgi:hypothetical protein
MTSRNVRPIPLSLSLLVALFSALAALAVSGGHDAHAHGNAAGHDADASHLSRTVTGRELALRTEMRKLWEDHITWTRLAIISLTTGSPDSGATVARLLRNQVDIGNAVKPFYGRAAGNELTRLLREHILIAADVIAAAKAGDGPKLADAQARWSANADRIASTLAGVNPRSWPLAAMKAECTGISRSRPRRRSHACRAAGRPTSPPTTGSTSTSCTWPTCSPPGCSPSSPTGSASRPGRATAA